MSGIVNRFDGGEGVQVGAYVFGPVW